MLEDIYADRLKMTDDIIWKHDHADDVKYVHRIFYDEQKVLEDQRLDARDINIDYKEKMLDPMRTVAKIEVRKRHNKMKDIQQKMAQYAPMHAPYKKKKEKEWNQLYKKDVHPTNIRCCKMQKKQT